MNVRRLLLLCAVALLSFGCGSLDYDLSSVPVPISSKPAGAGAAEVVPFEIRGRNSLYAHGLFGRSQPDIAALVAETSQGYDRIANFRVRQSAGFSHWLLTHLSLTMWRMKAVVISGELVRDGV